MSDAAKKELHDLVDALPDDEVKAARRYLEFLRTAGADPVRTAIERAPNDDEDPSWDEAEAAAGRADIEAGRTVTTAELKKELGLG